MRKFTRVITVIVFIFLYIPILVLGIASFNSGTDLAVFRSFTFAQYGELFHDSELLKLALNSLIIAVSSTILATLIGCQGSLEYEKILPAALNFGVTPVEIKEIVYQAVAYLGIGRVYPFLIATNKVLEEKGVKLPLEGQATSTTENRRELGTQAQVDIFGEGMRDFWQSGPEESKHINYWLADNCFGDYYTRTGLSYAQREMITFCFLAAQGGCEPQLTAHAAGNMKVGNDKAFLIRVISQCLPFIGYPRSLNALACVNKAAEADAK